MGVQWFKDDSGGKWCFYGGFVYDSTLLHANGFNVATECQSFAGTAQETECCGFYDAAPYRQPFVTGNLSCCEDVQTTFNPVIEECCANGNGIRSIGNC